MEGLGEMLYGEFRVRGMCHIVNNVGGGIYKAEIINSRGRWNVVGVEGGGGWGMCTNDVGGGILERS